MVAAAALKTPHLQKDLLRVSRQLSRVIQVRVRDPAWTEEKIVDLWQQHWQVDKKLQNQEKLPPSRLPWKDGYDLVLFSNHYTKSKDRKGRGKGGGGGWVGRGARDQSACRELPGRPIRLQGVAWQGKRVWETRIKCLNLVVQLGVQEVYCWCSL